MCSEDTKSVDENMLRPINLGVIFGAKAFMYDSRTTWRSVITRLEISLEEEPVK